MTAPDLDAIEASGKRWHGEDHRIVQVRWEPYKPDGQRQMKAKGRWQEQVGSGDFWRWQNCDRPVGLSRAPLAEALAVPEVAALDEIRNLLVSDPDSRLFGISRETLEALAALRAIGERADG